MTSAEPPNPWFSTINFNDSFFTENTQTITLAYANATYLKRVGVATSVASLTTFSGDVSVQGLATFGNTLTMNSATLATRQISAVDYQLQGLTTGVNNGQIYINGSALNIINSLNSGTITNYVKDSGGNSLSRLTIGSTQINSIEPLSLTGATDLDRIFNTVYCQFMDKTSLGTFVAQIYGSAGTLIFDNDVNGGSYNFAVNNSAGVQKTPLNFNALGATISTDNPLTATASLTVSDLTTGNAFIAIPNVGGGLYNYATDAGNILLLGKGTVDTEILQLSSHSNTNNYVKVRPTSVGMGAGGTSNTATSSVECNGSTVRIVPSLTFPDNSVQTTAFTGGGLTSGMIISYAGIIVPSGFLFCDGSQVSTTTYASLFAVLGTKYNTTTPTAGNFFLPDFRDRSPIGSATTALNGNILNGGLSNIAYNATIYNGNKNILANQLASHTHNLSWNSANFVNSTNASGNTTTGGSGDRLVSSNSQAFPTASGSLTNFFNFQGQGEYLTPVCSVNFIIKT